MVEHARYSILEHRKPHRRLRHTPDVKKVGPARLPVSLRCTHFYADTHANINKALRSRSLERTKKCAQTNQKVRSTNRASSSVETRLAPAQKFKRCKPLHTSANRVLEVLVEFLVRKMCCLIWCENEYDAHPSHLLPNLKLDWDLSLPI